MRILHLDGHSLFSEGLSSVLMRYGIEVINAYSAQSAIEMIYLHGNFDLIITNLSQPRLNSLDFIQSIEQQEWLLPVAVLIETDDLQIIETCLAIGVVGFIPMSYRAPQIINAIELMLDGDVYLPDYLEIMLDQLPNENQKVFLSKGSQRSI